MSEIPDWELEEHLNRILKKFGIKRPDPIECSVIALFMDARGFTQYSAQPDVTPFDIGQYLCMLQLGASVWFTYPRLPHEIKLPNGNLAQQVVSSNREPFWIDPVQIKFLGDGAMLLWEYNDNIECQILLANIFLLCWLAIDRLNRECQRLPFSPPSDLVFGLAHGRAAKFYIVEKSANIEELINNVIEKDLSTDLTPWL